MANLEISITPARRLTRDQHQEYTDIIVADYARVTGSYDEAEAMVQGNEQNELATMREGRNLVAFGRLGTDEGLGAVATARFGVEGYGDRRGIDNPVVVFTQRVARRLGAASIHSHQLFGAGINAELTGDYEATVELYTQFIDTIKGYVRPQGAEQLTAWVDKDDGLLTQALGELSDAPRGGKGVQTITLGGVRREYVYLRSPTTARRDT